MSKEQISLLIVDGNIAVVNQIKDLLSSDPIIKCDSVSTLSGAVEYMNDNEVDLVLLELTLEDSTGIETFIKIYSEFDVPIVVMSDRDNEKTALTVMRHGAQDVLVKNGVLNGRGLKRTIRHSFERCAFIKNNVNSICNHDAFTEAREIIRQSTKSLKQATFEASASHGDKEKIYQHLQR